MTGKFEVGDQLRFVNGQQHLDSLQFHNHPLFHDKVQVRSGIPAEAVVGPLQKLDALLASIEQLGPSLPDRSSPRN
ncbi:MAG: hypothetical protein ABSE93_09305 [Terriglobia bacterium]|jgi:hypothetical protein